MSMQEDSECSDKNKRIDYSSINEIVLATYSEIKSLRNFYFFMIEK